VQPARTWQPLNLTVACHCRQWQNRAEGKSLTKDGGQDPVTRIKRLDKSHSPRIRITKSHRM